MKRILSVFFLVFPTFFAAFAQQLDGPERALLNPAYAPFYHGVASGDPLPDRVILWTRITNTVDFTDTVNWQIATDTAFSNIVNSGTVVTDTSVDFTVKVDATGLQANTWYFYRFRGHGVYSAMGRTKTAPASGVNNLRFAVTSCAQMPNGFFHSYRDIVNRNDVDAVLFLGDYHYEYNSSSSVPGDTTRASYPALEPVTLSDYRLRHSQYKLDPDLREAHRQFPWISVWDDHEVANDSWMDGAQNHDTATQGSFDARKMASHEAYFEWMPIREAEPGNDSLIHRTLHYGNLVDLIMLDTRFEGRDKQVQGYLINVNDSLLNDTSRTILGATQKAWFLNQMNTSTATWKIIGNQVMIAPLWATIGASTVVVNPDQWDGYPHDRQMVFQNIMNNNVENVVFLTGDIHTSWANDLPLDRSSYNPATGAGSVAVEFVATSVTSSSDVVANVTPATVQSNDPYMKYIELSKRGYVLLDIDTARTQGDFIHVSDITQNPFTSTVDASWYVNKSERFLRQTTSAIGSRSGMTYYAPDLVSGIGEISNNLISLVCFPNPFTNVLKVQYYLLKAENVTASLFDITGKKVFEKALNGNTYGLQNETLTLPAINSGNYVLQLSSKTGRASFSLVKQ